MTHLRHSLLSTLAILLLSSSIASGAHWTNTSVGLTDTIAGARTVIIDQTGSTLYVMTTGNEVFKSTDAGTNWKSLGGISGVLALGFDAGSSSTLYAGTLHGVSKSTDGGDTWAPSGLQGTAVNVLAVDTSTPSTVYAGAGKQLYKSTDGAASWKALDMNVSSATGSGAISTIIVDPLTPSTLYVVAYGSPMYKSTDAGESWSIVNSGPFTSLVVAAPTNPPTLYAIRFGTGFSRSTDGGVTWSATGFNQVVLDVAIDPSQPKTLYAAVSGPNQTGQAIYKSSDMGQNWNAVNTTIPVALNMVVNPADPSTIYAATSKGGLLKSMDGGRNWSNANAGLRVFSIEVLAANPTDSATMYVGGAEGLFKSVDRGATWNAVAAFQVAMGTVPPGFPAPAIPLPSAGPATVRSLLIDSTNPDILYAGAHRLDGCFYTDIDFFKSLDGGALWSDSITPTQSGCLTDGRLIMDPRDPKTIYLPFGDIFDGYGLSRSTDGGSTWNFTGLAANEFYALAIDPANSAILYAAIDTGVSRSTDGGATWSMTGLTLPDIALLAIDPLQPNVVYAAGPRGLFKSADRGENWSPIDAGLSDVLDAGAGMNALLIDPDHTRNLYLGTSGYGVFKTSDGGATWAPANDGLSNLDVRALSLLRGDTPIVFAGTPGGVFTMVDGAQIMIAPQ